MSLRLAPTELPDPSRALCGGKALAVKAVRPRPGHRRAGLHDVLMPPPPPRPGRSAARPVVRPGRPGDGPGCARVWCDTATELSLDTYHASLLSLPFYDNRPGWSRHGVVYRKSLERTQS